MAFSPLHLPRQVAKVRDLVYQWNEAQPQCYAPWEWVEEMILARNRWCIFTRQRAIPAARENYARYEEFRKKLPDALVNQIL